MNSSDGHSCPTMVYAGIFVRHLAHGVKQSHDSASFSVSQLRAVIARLLSKRTVASFDWIHFFCHVH